VIKSVLTASAAAAFAASLLMPADVAARGFAGHFVHGFHHHHGVRPYGGAVVAYPSGVEMEPVGSIPLQINPAPHCTHSRETVTVPSEDGGERQVTITRC
jgi:hypothetical protein